MPMVTMAVDTVMVVMDMVVTVESVPLNLTMDMDTLDSHTLMVDTDTHTLMEVTTILARDLPNHLPTMVTDMAVVMDMAVTDMVDTDHTEDTDMAVMAMAMVVKSYLQEAKGFYY